MASEIVSKPATKKYRDNYDRVFKKKADCPRGKTVTGSSKGEPSRIDENIDWGECGRG